MKKYPEFDDTVVINKEIPYELFGQEYRTFSGQQAIVNDDYDEENDQLYVCILDWSGEPITYISVRLEDVSWTE